MKIKLLIILTFLFIFLNCFLNFKKNDNNVIKISNYTKKFKIINNKNYLYKIFNDSAVHIDNEKHLFFKGKILYFKKNNKNLKRKNEFLKYAYDDNFYFKPVQGRAQFYRIKLPVNIKIDHELSLTYTILKNEIDYQEKIKLKLHYLFNNKKDNYYGFFIPFNLYWNILKYDIDLKITIDDIYNLEIKKTKYLIPKEWDKQSVIFNDKKTSEILKFNRAKYEMEKKERLKIYNENNSSVFFNSGFIYPLDLTEYITSEFGLIREWKNQNGILFSRDIHTGLDFANNLNSSVYSAADGVVRYAKLSELIGNTIVIEHGLSLYSNYCHLNKINVNVGDNIKKQKIIGMVGSTGASTGYHLHWETKIYNYNVDPRSFFYINEIFKP